MKRPGTEEIKAVYHESLLGKRTKTRIPGDTQLKRADIEWPGFEQPPWERGEEGRST